jgi:hypothetical protein
MKCSVGKLVYIREMLATVQFRRSRDSSVGIAIGYGLDGRGSIPGEGNRFFFSAQRPDRLWGPPSLLCNG